MFYVNLKYCGTNLAALRQYLVIKDSSYTVKKFMKFLDFFTKPFRYWNKPMLTKDFLLPFKERIFFVCKEVKGTFYSVRVIFQNIFQNGRLMKQAGKS